MTAQRLPVIKILRDIRTSTVTLGRLLLDGEHVCHTLELPWLDNVRSRSCIPCGSYKCRIQSSPRFKVDLPELLDVPGRSQILIHPGNTVEDTEGCVLVGQERHGETVRKSRAAMAELMGILDAALDGIPDAQRTFWVNVINAEEAAQ